VHGVRVSEDERQSLRMQRSALREVVAHIDQAERLKVENVAVAIRGILSSNGAAGVLALALVATEVGE
jgi:hypothetical protein